MHFSNFKWSSVYLKKTFRIRAAEIDDNNLVLLVVTDVGADTAKVFEYMTPEWIELTLYFYHHRTVKSVTRRERIRYLVLRKRLLNVFVHQKPPEGFVHFNGNDSALICVYTITFFYDKW